MNHKASSKHMKNFAAKKSNIGIQHFIKKKQENKNKRDPGNKVYKAKLLLSGFMAEHGMAFSQADHLIKILKKMFPDSDNAQGMTKKKKYYI